MSLETREVKFVWRDIPGFCWDILVVAEKFEKKKFVFTFWPLNSGRSRRKFGKCGSSLFPEGPKTEKKSVLLEVFNLDLQNSPPPPHKNRVWWVARLNFQSRLKL